MMECEVYYGNQCRFPCSKANCLVTIISGLSDCACYNCTMKPMPPSPASKSAYGFAVLIGIVTALILIGAFIFIMKCYKRRQYQPILSDQSTSTEIGHFSIADSDDERPILRSQNYRIPLPTFSSSDSEI